MNCSASSNSPTNMPTARARCSSMRRCARSMNGLREKTSPMPCPTQRYRKRLAGVAVVLALAGGLPFLVSDAARMPSPDGCLRGRRWIATPSRNSIPCRRNYSSCLLPSPSPSPPALAETTEWRPEEASVRLPERPPLPRRATRIDMPSRSRRKRNRETLAPGRASAKERILVEPLPRPELASLEGRGAPSDYLRYSKDPVVPVRGNTLTLSRAPKPRSAAPRPANWPRPRPTARPS